MKKLLYIIIFIIIILVAWVVYPLIFPLSENQKIEQELKSAISAFQDKNRQDVLDHTVKDLKFKPHVDIDEVIMQLKGFFFQVRELKVDIQHIIHENKKLPRNAKVANVIFIVKINGKIDGQEFQSFGKQGVDAMFLKMKKVEETWKVAEIEYLDITNPQDAFKHLKTD